MLCFFLCLLWATSCGFPCFCVHLSIFVYVFMHVSLLAYLCHQIKLLLIISCGFTLIFVHEISSPYRSFVWWHMCRMYSNQMELRTLNTNPHLSFGTPFLVCLFTPLYAFFFFFLLVSMSLFLSLFVFPYLSASFVFSLLLHVHAWSVSTNSKMQTKMGKNASKKSKPKKGNDQ